MRRLSAETMHRSSVSYDPSSPQQQQQDRRKQYMAPNNPNRHSGPNLNSQTFSREPPMEPSKLSHEYHHTKRRRPTRVRDLKTLGSENIDQRRSNSLINGSIMESPNENSRRSLSGKVNAMSLSDQGKGRDHRTLHAPSDEYGNTFDEEQDDLAREATKEPEMPVPVRTTKPPPPPPRMMYPTSQKKTMAKQRLSAATQTNLIKLHVYDLVTKDALMLLPPFGCIIEIGQCFADMNSALHELGTGAYHVGIEVNGVEYAYGAATTPGRTGVFTCFPKTSPGFQYRTTIDLGPRPLVQRVEHVEHSKGGISEETRPVEATIILKEMAFEYIGTDYDLLRKNCCSFACDACQRLGVSEDEIPSWFRNLAESGAATQDVASAAVQPIASIASVLSAYDEEVEEELDGTEEVEEETTPEANKEDKTHQPTSQFSFTGMCE